MATVSNHVIARAGFTLRGSPWHFADFRSRFLPNIGENSKKFFLFERWAPGPVPYGESGPVIALRSLNG